MPRALRLPFRLAVPALLSAVVALPAAAQQSLPGSNVGQQNLQPYHFVFIAYALAWLLVFAWVVSVSRRLARVEKRLEE
jgi:CcmD family protein